MHAINVMMISDFPMAILTHSFANSNGNFALSTAVKAIYNILNSFKMFIVGSTGGEERGALGHRGVHSLERINGDRGPECDSAMRKP